MSKFPLCKKLGIEVHRWETFFSSSQGLMYERKEFKSGFSTSDWIKAADLELILEQAPVVKAGIETATKKDQKAGWLCDQTGTHSVYTYTARLLMIEPIQRDTAADMLNIACAVFDVIPLGKQAEQFIEQVKRLLDNKVK